jgi:hypothetical protein
LYYNTNLKGFNDSAFLWYEQVVDLQGERQSLDAAMLEYKTEQSNVQLELAAKIKETEPLKKALERAFTTMAHFYQEKVG